MIALGWGMANFLEDGPGGLLRDPSSEWSAQSRPTVVVGLLHEARDSSADAILDDARGVTAMVLFWRSYVFVQQPGRPGTGGCPRCLAVTLTEQQVPFVIDAQPHTQERAQRLWNSLSPLVKEEVEDLVSVFGSDVDGSVAYRVDVGTGEIDHFSVLPRVDCGRHQEQTLASQLALNTASRDLVKPGPDLRVGEGVTDAEEHEYTGLGGIFSHIRVDLDGPLGAVEVGVPLPSGATEPGIGRTASFRTSRKVAVLEGLERYAGIKNGGRRSREVGSYSELRDIAVDPRTLGTHASWQYSLQDYPFEQFDGSAEISWVWAQSIGDEKVQRLVPEDGAYWGFRQKQGKRLFYDSSNGSALGARTEEAALHGLLELIERDSFLLTWYRKLKLPEIEIDGGDPELEGLIRRCELFSGFRIRLYWAAMDTGIPVVIALAQSRSSRGPQTFLSAGAHLDPASAARSAVREVIGILIATLQTFSLGAEHGAILESNHDAVASMMDHSLLGAMASSREWYHFLSSSGVARLSLSELKAHAVENKTIGDDLAVLATALASINLEPFAIDMTTPEVAWAGLTCARAIVPGLLPMTFGHRNRRLEGFPRLSPAHRLPYESALEPGEDPYSVPPHPFP